MAKNAGRLEHNVVAGVVALGPEHLHPSSLQQQVSGELRQERVFEYPLSIDGGGCGPGLKHAHRSLRPAPKSSEMRLMVRGPMIVELVVWRAWTCGVASP